MTRAKGRNRRRGSVNKLSDNIIGSKILVICTSSLKKSTLLHNYVHIDVYNSIISSSRVATSRQEWFFLTFPGFPDEIRRFSRKNIKGILTHFKWHQPVSCFAFPFHVNKWNIGITRVSSYMGNIQIETQKEEEIRLWLDMLNLGRRGGGR